MTTLWEPTTTNSAGTKEWLEASKDLLIAAYVVDGAVWGRANETFAPGDSHGTRENVNRPKPISA